MTDGVISGESFRAGIRVADQSLGDAPVGCDGHSGMLSTTGPEQSPGDSAGVMLRGGMDRRTEESRRQI